MKAQGSGDNIHVFGTVQDLVTAAKIEGVPVIVHKGDLLMAALVTPSSGRFEVYLNCDHVYTLWFMQPGTVTKHIKVDGRDIPAELRAGGFGMSVDVKLFRALPNPDMSVLDQPAGKAH